MADLGTIGATFSLGLRLARQDLPPPGGVCSFGLVAYSALISARTYTTAVFDQSLSSIQTPPWWGTRPLNATPLPDYVISGTVVQRDEALVDTPIARCLVRLYYRPSGAFIARTTTDELGAFAFGDLMPGTGSYYAVAFDPEGAPVQNALIFDKLSSVLP